MPSELKLQSPDTVVEVRQGSQEPIPFTLLQDVDANEIIDTPINLTSITDLRFCLTSMVTNITTKHSTLDAEPIVAISSPSGGRAVFTPTLTTWQLSDVGYYGYIEYIDTSGKVIYVPEADKFTVVVSP